MNCSPCPKGRNPLVPLPATSALHLFLPEQQEVQRHLSYTVPTKGGW